MLHDQFDFAQLLNAAERDYFNVGLVMARSCNPKVLIREDFDNHTRDKKLRLIVKGFHVNSRTCREIPLYRVREVQGKLEKI